MKHIVKPPGFIDYGDPAALREAIEAVKAVHGVSQRAQAEAIGAGWTTMRNWLNGTASWPKAAQIALEVWADTPRSQDEAFLLDHCCFVPTTEDRNAMLEAWLDFLGNEGDYTLEAATADWTDEELLAFVREGRRITDVEWFCTAVDAQYEIELTEDCRKVIRSAARDYLKDAVMHELAKRLEERSE